MRFAIPLILTIVVTRAEAQSSARTLIDLRRDSTGQLLLRQRPRLGRNTRAMVLTTAGIGGAIGLFDSRLSLRVRQMGGDDMSVPSAVGSFVGGPVPLALGGSLYALGRGTGDRFVTQTGREVVRAVLVSGAITALLKGGVGRARPFASPGDPDEFSPGRGFTNSALASFPSGHTSAAFATATVLARELNVRHPSARWIVNPLLFGGAAFVGYSRIYQQQHWPSDVVAGAALGAITGYEVVAHAHGDRSPIARRFFSHFSIGPSKKGAAITWSPR